MIIPNRYYFFYIVTIAILVFLVLPFLIQEGMFMDGQQYACVSRNLAEGNSSFWFPLLSQTWLMQGSHYFMEHPPLFYGVESLFFKLFGSSFYTERIFSFTMLLFTALFIHLIWRLMADFIGANKSVSWFPVLIWIITPVCFWSYQNHMIETLLSVLTMASVFFALKGLFSQKNKVVFFILSGAFIYCSFLTKGFPGLFPLVTVPLFYLTTKRINLKEAIFYTGIIVLTFVTIQLFISWLYPSSTESLKFYVSNRVINRIEMTSTINYRLFIMRDLVMEFLPSTLICLTLFYFSKRKNNSCHIDKGNKQMFFFMLFVGFSASAPIMVTMVQKNFYLVPSIPFFALALSFINTKFLTEKMILFTSIPQRVMALNVGALILLSGVLIFSALQIGGISRDKSLITDVKKIGSYVGKNKIISTNVDTYLNWGFQFYLLRYYNISLDPRTKENKFYVKATYGNSNFPEGAKKTGLVTTDYELRKLISP
ncbi:MAG: glycosyltransferase family 39 protein [Bacteroidota bacterium]